MHWFMHVHDPSDYRIGTIGKNCIRRCETDGLPTHFRSDAATLIINKFMNKFMKFCIIYALFMQSDFRRTSIWNFWIRRHVIHFSETDPKSDEPKLMLPLRSVGHSSSYNEKHKWKQNHDIVEHGCCTCVFNFGSQTIDWQFLQKIMFHHELLIELCFLWIAKTSHYCL